jgi:GDPmannose 4,6-dehydratase
MLQQDKPEDYVIATGHQYSVRQFVDLAASGLGITLNWSGRGEREIGTVERVEGASDALRPGQVIVRVDPRYFRPTEVETLLGDATKAKNLLGWEPQTNFEELVLEMVKEDFKAAERDALVKRHGFSAYDYHE